MHMAIVQIRLFMAPAGMHDSQSIIHGSPVACALL